MTDHKTGGNDDNTEIIAEFHANERRCGIVARAELWPRLVAEAPQLGEFQTRTTRQPVFMLTRQD